MLTVAMDAVSFKEPTKVGDILYFTAVVTAVFKSSVEVMVSVFGEHPFEDDKDPFFVLDAFVTFVSVDDSVAPQTLQFELKPASEHEVQRMEVGRPPQPFTWLRLA
jgi:acyl-CoA hydrolase